MESLQNVSPEALEKAKEILRQRFKFTNREHPFVARMIRFAFSQLLEELAADIDAREPIPELDGREAAGSTTMRESLSLDDFLRQKINIVSLPQLVVQLQEAINSPKTSADDIAKIISNDVKLTASLLRLVNSPLYGSLQKIETVSRAVAMVGLKQLSSLAIGATLISSINKSVQAAELEEFWKHSIATASIARRMAEQCGRPEPERYFVDGLLHDIGRLFVIGGYPEEARMISQSAIAKGQTLHEAEVQFFGFSHTDIGGAILDRWNLSKAMSDAVRYHHTPEMADEASPSVAEIGKPRDDDHHFVHLADAMAKGLGYHAKGDFYMPRVSPASWELTCLREGDLEKTISDLHLEIDTVAHILLG